MLATPTPPVKHRRLLPLPALAALLTGVGGPVRADELPVVAWQGRTMGTVYTVKLVDAGLSPPQVEALREEVERRLAEINGRMSNYVAESELSRFNRAPADVPFAVSAETARVVRFALDVARRSGGAFDPTLGPLINLWGFGEKKRAPAVPPDPEVEATLARTGWRHLRVTDDDRLVKDIPDLALDLGGVAKGHGVNEIARLLEARGIGDFHVSIAGEVLVRGRSPRGDKWRLGIAAPVDEWREDDPMAAVVSLRGCALSTSGDYQKFFLDPRGRRISHIIDPRTGRPVSHMLGGVSVVAPDSMTADALGTTLFVLGPEAGLKFIDAWEGAAALFIIRQPDGSFRQLPSTRFGAMTAP